MSLKVLISVSVSFIFFDVFAQPIISGFSPTSGPIGVTVFIAGAGFNAAPSNNIVYFGATRATVTSATITQLAVTVPAGATYQPITVLTNGLIAYSTKPFVVTFNGNQGFDSSSFAPREDFSIGNMSNNVFSGDLDEDGLSDLVFSTVNDNRKDSILILKNTSSSAGISFANKINIGSTFFRSSASIGDLNGDGKLDIVITDSLKSTISIYVNSSAIGNISFLPKIDIITSQHPSIVSIADLDRDGRADIFCGNFESISIFKNTSSFGLINFAPEIALGTGTNLYSSIAVSDLDGDGMVDLVVTSSYSGTLSIFKNTSSKGFISFASKIDLSIMDFSDVFSPGLVLIGDIDDDGKGDLIVSSLNYLSVFRNVCTSEKMDFLRTDYTAFDNRFSISIGDLDGDGRLDLVSNKFIDNTIYVLKNTTISSSIGFDSEVKYPASAGYPSKISIIDLNNDGKSDLAVSNFSGAITILRNTIKTNQALTFETLQSKVLGDVTFTFSATSSSGLPVTYSATPTDKVTISGNQVTLMKTGKVTITASQAGNSDYNPAISVDQTFCIRPAKPIVIAANLNTTSPMLSSNAAIGNQWYLNGVILKDATNPTLTTTQSGTYKVQVTIENCASDFSENQPLIVTGDISSTNTSAELYPNPVTDWLKIVLSDEEVRKEITLFNLTGQPIASQKVLGKEAQFNVADYLQGMYIAKVLMGEKTKVIKFVKQ
jgi:hypothetical protein